MNFAKEKAKIAREKAKLLKEITKQKTQQLKQETKKHTVTAIVAAFGFLIALVWRDVIKNYVEYLVTKLSITAPEIILSLYSAIITTIIAVIGIVLVNRWATKPESNEKLKQKPEEKK